MLLVATTFGLTACVPPPPRQTVVYHATLQDQQQTLVAHSHDAEERAHPSLRGKPGAPMPVATGERAHVAGELRVGKCDGICSGYFEHLW